MNDAADRELIDEQIAYYRARAHEYDQTSSIEGDPFEAASHAVRAALRGFAPRGRIIELAAGTGQWTADLARDADVLLAVDASSEMLERNAVMVGDPHVRYAVADVFSLPPDRSWDVVFFGFFLSHVRRRTSRPSGTPCSDCSPPVGASSSSTRHGTTSGARTGSTSRPASCVER